MDSQKKKHPSGRKARYEIGTLYDIVGPRCLDCVFCRLTSDLGKAECRANPPVAGKGWPKLPADEIANMFCGCFTTTDVPGGTKISQPLKQLRPRVAPIAQPAAGKRRKQ